MNTIIFVFFIPRFLITFNFRLTSPVIITSSSENVALITVMRLMTLHIFVVKHMIFRTKVCTIAILVLITRPNWIIHIGTLPVIPVLFTLTTIRIKPVSGFATEAEWHGVSEDLRSVTYRTSVGNLSEINTV